MSLVTRSSQKVLSPCGVRAFCFVLLCLGFSHFLSVSTKCLPFGKIRIQLQRCFPNPLLILACTLGLDACKYAWWFPAWNAVTILEYLSHSSPYRREYWNSYAGDRETSCVASLCSLKPFESDALYSLALFCGRPAM